MSQERASLRLCQYNVGIWQRNRPISKTQKKLTVIAPPTGVIVVLSYFFHSLHSIFRSWSEALLSSYRDNDQKLLLQIIDEDEMLSGMTSVDVFGQMAPLIPPARKTSR
jgi:hypothetical protein